MLDTLFSALAGKVASGAVSAVTAAGLVAGATGHLPDAMQDGLSQAAQRVGISIPAGGRPCQQGQRPVPSSGPPTDAGRGQRPDRVGRPARRNAP